MYSMNDYLNAPVSHEVPNEKPKPNGYRCFPGAWYYKALSSKDQWLGIEATITLPEFYPDSFRFEMIPDQGSNQQEFKKYLDTPSIYVGGSSDYETDIGFGWFRGLVHGRLSEEKITFRPFWRYIYLEDGNEKNEYEGTPLFQVEHYYFPGDTVKIHLFCTEEHYLQFRAELIKPTKIPKYDAIRKTYSNQPMLLLTGKIPAPGNGVNDTEYKRVNAIDQYHNEGKLSRLTSAKVECCSWEEVYLFRTVNKELLKVPFSSSRYIQMFCPNEESFHVETNGVNEKVWISPK